MSIDKTYIDERGKTLRDRSSALHWWFWAGYDREETGLLAGGTPAKDTSQYVAWMQGRKAAKQGLHVGVH